MENKWAIGAAKASGDVVALALEREQFIRVLGDDLKPLIRHSIDKKKLVRTPRRANRDPHLCLPVSAADSHRASRP